jgi:hypothetical protein
MVKWDLFQGYQNDIKHVEQKEHKQYDHLKHVQIYLGKFNICSY